MPKNKAQKLEALTSALDAAVQAAGSTGRRYNFTFEESLRKYPIAPDYLWGRHTHAIAAELQAASEAVERGECYYVIISVPPRHGKSDLCSRAFPPHHLHRNPDHEIILSTYAATLSEDLSHEARRRFELLSEVDGIKLSADRNQIGAWRIENHRGGLFAIGLGGSITGRGAHILLLDDYLKNRAEAESETIREGVWDAFRSDLLTRLAPAHAVIILATRWHEDDLIGRIEKQMQADAKFPRFKFINFPAWDFKRATDELREILKRDPETKVDVKKLGWLFPERFPATWYEAQQAAVGSYAWGSLYQGNPQPRTGRLLRADLVKIIKPGEVPQGLRYVRFWDLASTEKQRIKDDPDFTVGVKGAYHAADQRLYVVDVIAGQWGATGRDARILKAAKDDGPATIVKVESVAGYKDTFIRVRDLLRGKAIVKNDVPQGDKVSRACNTLEVIFEAGNVFIVEAPWNADWIAEHTAFPRGKHDDRVDGTVGMAAEALKQLRRAKLS